MDTLNPAVTLQPRSSMTLVEFGPSRTRHFVPTTTPVSRNRPLPRPNYVDVAQTYLPGNPIQSLQSLDALPRPHNSDTSGEAGSGTSRRARSWTPSGLILKQDVVLQDFPSARYGILRHKESIPRHMKATGSSTGKKAPLDRSKLWKRLASIYPIG